MKSKGQYFTKNESLQNKVFEFIKNSPNRILEPSVGRGDLVLSVRNRIDVPFDMYEIDNTIDFILDDKYIIFGDFLDQNINIKYKTIIGNPPYVRTKSGNLYIDFIEKCVSLLEPNGELIFIVPTDFFKLTSARKLLNYMYLHGNFTDIYHPNNENLFENASIDIMIFRYCLDDQLTKKTKYNGEELYINNSNGLITFTKEPCINNYIIGDYFNIYVGLVTGKEEIYKNEELGNISLFNDLNCLDKYIFIKKFPCDNEKINKYLLENKDVLIKRKIRKFNDTNWFEWGAPRNIKIMEENYNEQCIYIRNLTRFDIIAFEGNIQYFGGKLLMLKPKKNVNLTNVINYLNSKEFKRNFTYSGRFKIGQKQLLDSIIPHTIQLD